MSGTSLDGVDIALCEFTVTENNSWSYKIKQAKTYEYDEEWKAILGIAHNLDGLSIIQFHKDYGHYLGKLVNDFMKSCQSSVIGYQLSVDFIASHGHTVFHQPEKGITFQLGEGASIAAETGITTICDFRTTDVALGGQGAPLVPIGDKKLFSDYDFCLNLGGFANISYDKDDKCIGYDICPVNIILNTLANEAELPYDDKGKLASSGNINNDLLAAFSFQPSAISKGKKSLSREWMTEQFLPIVNKYNIPTADKLRTITEYISLQISDEINSKAESQKSEAEKILVTGGGAYNDFLIKCIREKTKHEVIVPDNYTIEFKEALIFAFLGVLRMRNEVNCLSSVTGASRDNIGGAIYN